MNVDTESEEKIKREEEENVAGDNTLEKLLRILEDLKVSVNEDEAVKEVMRALSAKGVVAEPISYKRGFKMVLAEVSDKRYVVWVRASPISRVALENAERMISKYELDGKILLKLRRRADYVRVREWVKVTPRENTAVS